jgi:hypothetical protein
VRLAGRVPAQTILCGHSDVAEGARRDGKSNILYKSNINIPV